MKKMLVTVALSLLLTVAATAQTALTFVALGYCQLTSLGTAKQVSTCSGGIPLGATLAVISVEGAGIRYRDDGVAPTASVGMPVATGQAFTYQSTLVNLQIIQQSASATVDILFYR
jgi:hypothetical protein